jgi:uncharacterized protein YndB with AHSA1/START domain
MPSDEVSLRRLLKARRALVFEAWTRPELMARWFFPDSSWSATIEHELKVGGRWQVLMKEPGGVTHNQFGVYREIVPDSRLVFTWSCPDLQVVDSVVTLELYDHEAGTELLLSHELPPDANVRRGHDEGWQGCLGNLQKLLETAN